MDVVIFDRQLSPSQLRNLEQLLDCAILDRTSLILEIFAVRARTREARLQVEIICPGTDEISGGIRCIWKGHGALAGQ